MKKKKTTSNKISTDAQNSQNIRKEKKKLNKKGITAIIIGIGIFIYLIYTIYLLIKQPTNVFTVEEGKLYQEEIAIGYVIRDEKVIKGENYKNGMEQIIEIGRAHV